MIHLLYLATAIAVRGAAQSFQYAAPFMTAAAALYWRGELSTIGRGALCLAALAALGMPYISATMHAMLRGEAPPFKSVLRWRRRDADFFFFTAISFLFGGLLVAFVAEIGAAMAEYAAETASDAAAESRASPRAKYGYGEGATIVALFGSRAFAAAFLLAALLLWGYFFRCSVRIPAYIDGYDLSAEEAIDLTSQCRLQILAASLFINIGLSTAATLAPWENAAWWTQAAMTGVAAWVFLHANLALSAAMYQQYAAGYRMRPLRIF